MSVTHVIGIDPGLVHTGLVELYFDDTNKVLDVDTKVTSGIDLPLVKAWCAASRDVYIEQYRPRQRLQQDVRMVQLEQDLRRTLPTAKFLTNMGIKNVVTEELMRLLGLWKFTTVTHHQDLRSAARIALLGMMKNADLNEVLSTVVREHIDQQNWTTQHG